MSDSDISEEEEAATCGDDDPDGKFILAKDGTAFVRWEKMAGRTVDPCV